MAPTNQARRPGHAQTLNTSTIDLFLDELLSSFDDFENERCRELFRLLGLPLSELACELLEPDRVFSRLLERPLDVTEPDRPRDLDWFRFEPPWLESRDRWLLWLCREALLGLELSLGLEPLLVLDALRFLD